MQPDDRVTGADFAVNDVAVSVALHASRFKAERLDQEVVRGGDVLADHHGNDLEKRGHCSEVRTGQPLALDRLARKW